MNEKIDEIGKRGVIFHYDYNLVYLIKGDKRIYLCDTHEGPKSMKPVEDYIARNNLDNKKLIVFNSHSDFDHNWGNCAFSNEIIIGHEFNLERFKLRGKYDYEVKSQYQQGNVELVYPNLTFKQNLTFTDDEVEFIYSPGHTICSAICHNKIDSTVYVGDLVEAPIPVILWDKLSVFVDTLKYIKRLSKNNTVLTSHSGIVNKQLIEDNIEYVSKLSQNKKMSFKAELAENRHIANKKNLLLSEFENKAQELLGDEFDYKLFKKNFWKQLGVDYGELTEEYKITIETDDEVLKDAFAKYIKEIK